MTTLLVCALATTIVLCVFGHGDEIHIELPSVLLEHRSPLNNDVAGRMIQDITTCGFLSTQLCKDAGFVSYNSVITTGKISSDHGRTLSERKYEDFLLFRFPDVQPGKMLTMPPLQQPFFEDTKFLHPILEPTFRNMSLADQISLLHVRTISDLATAMEISDAACREKSIPPGEVRGCHATSESMISMVKHVLIPRAKACKSSSSSRDCTIKHVMVSLPKDMSLRSNYNDVKIISVEPIANKTSVLVCHPVVFAYSLYMCHAIPKNAAFLVTLKEAGGGNKNVVTLPIVCHYAGFVKFKVPGAKPGETICHWVATSSIVWYV